MCWEVLRTDSQALVLPAEQYGRYNITRNEQQQEDVVKSGVAQSVKDTEADQAYRPDDSEDY